MKSLVHHPAHFFCSAALLSLLLLSCEESSSPSAPSTPSPASPARYTDVVVWIRDTSGACLEGAEIDVLDGTRAGIKRTQATCGPFWEGGGAFVQLPTGITVRLRASKPGFKSDELTVVPGNQSLGIDVVLIRE